MTEIEAIRQVPQAGAEAIQQTQQSAEQFEQHMNAAASNAEMSPITSEQIQTASVDPHFRTAMDPNSSLDAISLSETQKLETELQTKVLKLDRAEQTRYFAEKIEPAYEILQELRTRAEAADPRQQPNSFLDGLDRYDDQFAELTDILEEFASGKDFSQKELLRVQIRSHQIMQSMEILSKTVEQSVSGMKTIFQTNV